MGMGLLTNSLLTVRDFLLLGDEFRIWGPPDEELDMIVTGSERHEGFRRPCPRLGLLVDITSARHRYGMGRLWLQFSLHGLDVG